MRAHKPGFIQSLLSTGPFIRMGLFIGQYMPRWVGYGVASLIAGVIVRFKTATYWTVSNGLRHVLNAQIDDRALHRMVWRVVVNAGRSYYEFYRAANWPAEKLAHAVHVPPSYMDMMKQGSARGQGTLLLGLHMSNYDLAMVSIASRGISTQVLTLADPGEGFRVQDRLRATVGIEVTQITPESLRLAVRRLQSGWIIFTGVDRPVPDERQPVELFGRLSNLSTGPARIALLSGATVLVASCHYSPHVGYVVNFTGPVELVRSGDRSRDIQTNARRIAAVIEQHVRAYPDQWLMFHPLWPHQASTEGA